MAHDQVVYLTLLRIEQIGSSLRHLLDVLENRLSCLGVFPEVPMEICVFSDVRRPVVVQVQISVPQQLNIFGLKGDVGVVPGHFLPLVVQNLHLQRHLLELVDIFLDEVLAIEVVRVAVSLAADLVSGCKCGMHIAVDA